MKRTLAILRRLFLAGSVSLLIIIFIIGSNIHDLLNLNSSNIIKISFSLYFILSPILYLVITIISIIYLRHHGQFALYWQSMLPIVNFFGLLRSDITSPFINIKNSFLAFFSKNVIGRHILIIRFFELLFLIVICIVGIKVCCNI